MSYGKLSLLQLNAILPFVRDRTVHDLGCGYDLQLAMALAELGAKEVVAVDTVEPDPVACPKLRIVRANFDYFSEPVHTAFVSWPANRANPGLVRIVESADYVIYLGKCRDYVMCGSPQFYGHLMTREVLVHMPERNNDLVIYGPHRQYRTPLPEEMAGTDHSRVYFSDGPPSKPVLDGVLL